MKIGIVIPTLNEEGFLENTIARINAMAFDLSRIEIVVVDSGSTDATVNLAEQTDAKVYCKPTFKGNKYMSLNLGAKQITCNALFFLDADCLVPQHFDLHIENVLYRSKVVGGAFEFQMEKGGTLVYLIIQFINRIRYRITKLYYGDQGVFCLKDTFDKIGGFPKEPIMESAYFCRLLKKEGKLRLIHSPVISSIRRFKDGGIHRVFWKDFWIWVQFWLGLDISRYAQNYWHENEKRTA